MRNQSPMHEPALIAAFLTDNDGNVGEVPGAMLKRGVKFGEPSKRYRLI